MTAEEFNEKWKDHLKKGHYGLALNISEVTEYIDGVFTALLATHPDFTYSQIKEKFNHSRVYMNNVPEDLCRAMEVKINELLK